MSNEQWLLWLILYMLVVLGIARLLHWVLLRTGAGSNRLFIAFRILCALVAVAYPVVLAFPALDAFVSTAGLVAAIASLVCIQYTAWGSRMPWILSLLLTVLLLCENLVGAFFFIMFSGGWRT